MTTQIQNGTKVTVNLNSEGTIINYDRELDMYEVRLMDGNRFVGDVVVPLESISVNEKEYNIINGF